MMNKCVQCGREYQAKRVDSRTCSPKCRQSLKRLSVTDAKCDKVDNVTDNRRRAILSDGQEFTPDPKPQQMIDTWYKGHGTVRQGQLSRLSLQYDILHGSPRAKQHACKVMDRLDGQWMKQRTVQC